MEDNSSLEGIRKVMMLALITCIPESEIFEIFKKIALQIEAYTNYPDNILLLKDAKNMV